MKDTIRTFIAIKISSEEKLKGQLQSLKTLFKDERINWVDPDNFHLTLRFLGETSREQLNLLHPKLQQLSSQFKQFNFDISGLDTFGNKGNPRVLFVNIQFPEELEKLVKDIENAVVSVGFHSELKPFRPHLTLGRIKHLSNRSLFIKEVNQIPNSNYQSVQVSEIILYQSILRPSGPEYKPIHKYSLQ